MKINKRGFSGIELLAILFVVGLLSIAGWYVYGRTKDKKTPTNAISQKASDEIKTSEAQVNLYKIDQLKIALTLNDKTSDLSSMVDGNNVWFSLKRYTDASKNCEKMAAITVLANIDEVRKQPTDITGDLIDPNGNPIENRIFKLADGRYALPSSGQAPCLEEGSPLFKDEPNAINAINDVFKTIQSY